METEMETEDIPHMSTGLVMLDKLIKRKRSAIMSFK